MIYFCFKNANSLRGEKDKTRLIAIPRPCKEDVLPEDHVIRDLPVQGELSREAMPVWGLTDRLVLSKDRGEGKELPTVGRVWAEAPGWREFGHCG